MSPNSNFWNFFFQIFSFWLFPREHFPCGSIRTTLNSTNSSNFELEINGTSITWRSSPSSKRTIPKYEHKYPKISRTNRVWLILKLFRKKTKKGPKHSDEKVHDWFMKAWSIFDGYEFTFGINKVLICFGRDLHSIPETSNLAIFSIYSLDFNFGNSSVNIDFDSR